MNEIPNINVYISSNWEDYELIDSGDGLKLERFGQFLFIRPEAQAVWKRHLPSSRWEKADAVFETTGEENGGHWNFRRKPPEHWPISYHGIKCWAQAGSSRHLGLFPEQAVHWDWMMDIIRAANRPLKVLNLFGYTGMATLAAASAGATVTHIDASKKAISWARENQALSALDDSPIRWIVDDALKFIQREARRGSFYDGLILDPPKFGRGPKGEVWEFFELLPDLLSTCRGVMSKDPAFVILTAYAIKSSALTLHGAAAEMLKGFGGSLEIGELATRESSAGRLISNAITARWHH